MSGDVVCDCSLCPCGAPKKFKLTISGKQHHVSFEETFVEVWTWTILSNVGPHFERDNHLSRPQGLARCLEEKTGLSFRTVGDRLFLGERLVEQWVCNVSATFTVVNGDYRNWSGRGNAFYTSPNNFNLTALVIDNRPVAHPTPCETFDHMFYPGVTNLAVPNQFPPPITQGVSRTSSDQWRAVYEKGDRSVTNTYTRVGY